ncbi:AraC family transcriptional regulator [Pseudoclavibacter chungangensis]|uniref:AraC family transcriptional regulator n=1 Tax=Pseudoclavibacter chungangensis TaxID=587635 RepID=A0A7J5BZ64_9MICO|nr:GyrI-like domain-containing protein [Pseudoclavibacter chungangensis]KAB1659609.1 AraC family transcriptional regulator [Pseudoclavibacter chungangensis]NYJ67432.1 effector-binding domain-containing protein [Pseudoclavibacter chungangensis]
MNTEQPGPEGPWPKPVVLDDLEPRHTAVVRRDSITMAGVHELFDHAFGPVAEAVGGSGAHIAGPAFAAYDGDLSGSFAIELGFPVDGSFTEPVDAGGEHIIPSTLPGGRVAVVTHIGPYDELPNAWSDLVDAVATSGGTIGSPMWEVYVTEPTPDTDPATLRTDLFIVVEQTG